MAGALALALSLSACGGSTSTPSDSVPTESASSEATGSADGPASPTGKVSATNASEDEIVAALEAAGVSNADRWAEEVVEYRPYPADDPNLTKLRDNLAKYNPGQETTDKIVSALTP
jgi:hypothetical protein